MTCLQVFLVEFSNLLFYVLSIIVLDFNFDIITFYYLL